ncbi:hypothetical protein PUR71_02195 [Streptomyces sp. SP17BM10]|uniref:hypothetical protein n=1 Tax=Streptomyces sp. SP17BM10 TaxID=3002530 RepID=UPI002E78A6B6|nr:hypothetical protein [Streptomyces sp. SP17BM10]MEE1781748.1 hypothetical protein [Streptomyces sp. SP17BM10]
MREQPTEHLAQAARLVARAPQGGGRRRLHADGPWLYLHDPAMPALDHGWTLHLSARAPPNSRSCWTWWCRCCCAVRATRRSRRARACWAR